MSKASFQANNMGNAFWRARILTALMAKVKLSTCQYLSIEIDSCIDSIVVIIAKSLPINFPGRENKISSEEVLKNL